MTFAPETIFAMANIALLSGIFLRLGGLAAKQDDFSRRLGRIEEGKDHA